MSALLRKLFAPLVPQAGYGPDYTVQRNILLQPQGNVC